MQFQKKRCVAMLLAGGQGSRLMVLTENTAKPAVPFGGKYRIIDFPLSNCVNSKHRHGRHSDPVSAAGAQRIHRQRPAVGPQLARTAACRSCRPTPRAKTPSGTRARPTPSIRISPFIERYDPDNVLILSGDHIYKMDYAAMLPLPRADATPTAPSPSARSRSRRPPASAS